VVGERKRRVTESSKEDVYDQNSELHDEHD
jgi:hypothetical protein